MHDSRPVTWLIGLWATSGGVELAAHWRDVASNSIGLINTALITIGSTAILIYQRVQAAKVEARRAKHAADLADGLVASEKKVDDFTLEMKDHLKDVKERLSTVIDQRDELIGKRDELVARVIQLTEAQHEMAERLVRVACRRPNPDGSARCTIPELRHLGCCWQPDEEVPSGQEMGPQPDERGVR